MDPVDARAIYYMKHQNHRDKGEKSKRSMNLGNQLDIETGQGKIGKERQ